MLLADSPPPALLLTRSSLKDHRALLKSRCRGVGKWEERGEKQEVYLGSGKVPEGIILKLPVLVWGMICVPARHAAKQRSLSIGNSPSDQGLAQCS